MFGKKEKPNLVESIKATPETSPVTTLKPSHPSSTAEPNLYARIPILIMREAGYSDKESIFELGASIPELQCSEKESFLSREGLQELLEDYSNKTMLAEIEGKLIGFAIGKKESSDNGCIYFVGIDPSYRHQGLGKALIKSVEDKLRTESIYLLATNESAIEIFEKLGYQRGKTLTYMSKTLIENQQNRKK